MAVASWLQWPTNFGWRRARISASSRPSRPHRRLTFKLSFNNWTGAAVVGKFHTALARNANARDSRSCGGRPTPVPRYGRICLSKSSHSATRTNSRCLSVNGSGAVSSITGNSRCWIKRNTAESVPMITSSH